MKYLLKSMQMARSTYYFELSKADQVAVRNHCLADEIKDIFSQHKGRYGVRRVYQELIKRGHKVNHKRVQRLMHTMGLAGKRPKEKYHSYKGEVGKVEIQEQDNRILFTDKDGNDRMQEEIQANYDRIRQEVRQIVEDEITRIKNDPELCHLIREEE